MEKTDWIRTARINHGLKGFELAERLGVSAARVSVLEKDEQRGALTLKTMEKAARAMGCRFEYRIVCDASSKMDVGGQSGKPRYRVITG